MRLKKPLVSNQHGALVMAFVPFLYAILQTEARLVHLWLGLSWLFAYLFSYPFLALFRHKETAKYQPWVWFYATLSLLFALPLLFEQPAVLQFLLPSLPLVGVQIYYTKQKDERHLYNDIAGILIFGIVGMAASYLVTQQYDWAVLREPTLFFIATTFYIKSVARERKNPRYKYTSWALHLLCLIYYALLSQIGLLWAYGVALLRALIVPKLHLNLKQVGILECLVVSVFLFGLA